MRKLLLATGMLVAVALPAQAQDTYRFAIVPKAMNNPYFDLSRDGCMARAEELGNVECTYIGPVEHEPATQVQIIQDLISQGVDGIAISVSDAGAVTKVVQQAIDAGIAVITFDADAPDSARQAHVGTDNRAFGRELGELLKSIKAEGGTYAMISGGPAAANLNDRVEGVREALDGSGWTEVSGSPLFCNDDMSLAVQQMSDVLTANPDLDAIIPVGGWPMFVPEAYKGFVDAHREAFDSGELALVVADTLEVQLELLRDGYANGLVGQRPYEMGEKAMDILLALKEGQEVEDITYAGLDVVTPDNVEEFLN
ncbi:MAG TPA: sugar-binding protein [Alphaproteobacteria bacterium]|nr:sugar-binding protein [Alphaproteobacteria bacterium]